MVLVPKPSIKIPLCTLRLGDLARNCYARKGARTQSIKIHTSVGLKLVVVFPTIVPAFRINLISRWYWFLLHFAALWLCYFVALLLCYFAAWRLCIFEPLHLCGFATLHHPLNLKNPTSIPQSTNDIKVDPKRKTACKEQVKLPILIGRINFRFV